jgi:hypothetical protein
VYWSEKLQKWDFSTFHFNTYGFLEPEKCFFASKMCQIRIARMFPLHRGVISRKNFSRRCLTIVRGTSVIFNSKILYHHLTSIWNYHKFWNIESNNFWRAQISGKKIKTNPHWSYELIFQITPWTKILCSYAAISAPETNGKIFLLQIKNLPKVNGVTLGNKMLFVGRFPSKT